MIKGLQSFALLLSLLLFGRNLHAQLLPPNQPEQDILNALVFCGTTFTTNYAYQGRGLAYELTGTPCGGGEDNVVWLKVSVNTPGDIVFKITPLITTDDYDFAVIEIPGSLCGGITNSNVIRCNFNNNNPGSNVNGEIGLNLTSTLTTVAGGTFGSSYLQKISAQVGDVYLIMINNFGYYTGIGGPSSGFTIDFAGSTALFNQPQNLRFKSFVPYCDKSKSVVLELNDYVQCSSIAADGSDFQLSSGTITSAQGLNCSPSSGFTKQVKINFAGTLPNGNYNLKARTGTDVNTLIGICGSPLALPDSIDFYVGLDNPIMFTTIDSPACQQLTIHFNTPFYCSSLAPNGSDYKITGPSTVNIASAVANDCECGFAQSITLNLSQPIAVDGMYNVVSQLGNDNNTLYDSCNRIQAPGNSIPFKVNSFNGILKALPDTTICNVGSTISLYGINNGPVPSSGFNYLWIPSTGIQNPNALVTPLVVPDLRNHYVLQTIDANGCYLRDSVKINVQPFHGELSPTKTSVCLDDPLQLVASGGSQYNWFDNAGLTSVPNATLDCTNCAEPKALPPLGDISYYVLITNNLGCKDTLKVDVRVNPLPVIESFPVDTTIAYGKSVELRAQGGQIYTWYPGGTLNDSYSASPLATPRETTHYVVTGTNEFGCRSTDTSIVRLDYRSDILIPNAFSPNGDGLNDEFMVMNLKYQKVLEFKVFDRWGKMLFETTNATKGWDGNYKGTPLGTDVYYYLIRLGHPDELVETFTGDVTLIR